MTSDDDFEPHLGRIRSVGKGRAGTFLNRVLAATNLARGGAAQSPPGRKSRFDGSRIGRGSGVGRVLSVRDGYSALRQRRVIIKSRIVKLAGKGLSAARAHLRYIQRDGVTRDGAPGQLYTAGLERCDDRAFLDRAGDGGDRHQFRFIVSPEDGHQYDDLKPFVRRLMTQMEEDIDTRLDWVAVDHYNTGHPHSHIIVRGRDDVGKDLIIAREYITTGLRERAAEIVRMDFGPRSDFEIEATLKQEVDQERFTSLDRTLIRDRDKSGVVAAVDRDALRQSLRAGRLQKLKRLGLAEDIGAGRWQLAPDLEPILRRMGERGDIIKTLHRDMAAQGRPWPDLVIHQPDTESPSPEPIVGQLIRRGLSDELKDRHYMIIDGVDGRLHYVDIGQGERTQALPVQAIVRLSPNQPDIRQADLIIAEVAAASGGYYDVEAHLRHDPLARENFVETHYRRLEAIRRSTGGPDRDADGRFRIDADYLNQALSYEQKQARSAPVRVELLSALPPDRLITIQAATWLDHELVAEVPKSVIDAGFGKAVRAALNQRRQWLIGEGLAREAGEAQTVFKTNLIETLKRCDLRLAAGQLSEDLGLNFVEMRAGQRIDGTLRDSLDLVSGKMAVVELTSGPHLKARDFTLVPWRPVLENHIGKPISGIVREGGINWTIGRQRGLGIE
ncbi:relaxase/mobilization nuclease RlxS [Asticcacaulis sp. SL142]|uniref:relaxase/mobilization nuclease RlxS n=1 Tax=Asticcacaulis sp. SL142 TaxID=2995155 RepID=UPI00226CE1AF|nr:relaxase/mobilization nuclease RlxS [Asticcacaulis sp. SL142]WAC49766.1 relaxase/mobilization nuclease RlxS [Asticcacaulis sp. SL142]